MKKTITLCAISMIIGICTGFIVCQNTTVKEYKTTCDFYDNYNKNTEVLLDSIESWDIDYFDTISWTEEYQTYLESRTLLDSILYNK